MASVRATLTQIVDNAFPTFGAFVFADVSGQLITIHEKLPVIGVEETKADLGLPLNVSIPCKIVSKDKTKVLIDTSEPYAIEDLRGQNQFWVNTELVDA